jgi:hypothetical protein
MKQPSPKELIYDHAIVLRTVLKIRLYGDLYSWSWWWWRFGGTLPFTSVCNFIHGNL